MKIRVCILLVSLMATVSMMAQKDVIRKSNGSITFVVDEGLEAPEEHLFTGNSSQVVNWLMMEKGLSHNHGVVRTSFDGRTMAAYAGSTFFQVMTTAFAEHRPVVLTPDMVWLLISQGFAQHVNQNPEKLRPLLVNHKGELTLQAIIEDNDYGKELKDLNWEVVFDQFVDQINKNSKNDIAKTMTADFSTTGTAERIASQVTTMNAFQHYFKYEVIRLSCGIPYITLKGTPDDWYKVIAKTKALEKYNLKWWTDKLIPILEEFVKTAQGKPNRQFWRCIVKKIPVDELRGGGCSREMPTKLDGWFINFFPYDENGRTPAEVSREHKMLNELLSVDFKYKEYDKQGHLKRELPMQFLAGFVGVVEDEKTFGLTPQIGWMVREVNPAKQEEKKTASQKPFVVKLGD